MESGCRPLCRFHMKQPTPLGVYLYERRISSEQFAVMMANELNLKKFSYRTVEKWRTGERVPNSRNMRAIKALTGITADQMLGESA